MTADEAEKLIASARIKGGLPELQCSAKGIRSPEHYRQLVEVVETARTAKLTQLLTDIEALENKNEKLERENARLVSHCQYLDKDNTSLRNRLFAATEMKACPPTEAERARLSTCTCAAIQANDSRRHFRECPLREDIAEPTIPAPPVTDTSLEDDEKTVEIPAVQQPESD